MRPMSTGSRSAATRWPDSPRPALHAVLRLHLERQLLCSLLSGAGTTPPSGSGQSRGTIRRLQVTVCVRPEDRRPGRHAATCLGRYGCAFPPIRELFSGQTCGEEASLAVEGSPRAAETSQKGTPPRIAGARAVTSSGTGYPNVAATLVTTHATPSIVAELATASKPQVERQIRVELPESMPPAHPANVFHFAFAGSEIQFIVGYADLHRMTMPQPGTGTPPDSVTPDIYARLTMSPAALALLSQQLNELIRRMEASGITIAKASGV